MHNIYLFFALDAYAQVDIQKVTNKLTICMNAYMKRATYFKMSMLMQSWRVLIRRTGRNLLEVRRLYAGMRT
jgi:hypothetical protein